MGDKNGNNNTKTNYQEQLNWFNQSVKPVILTNYQKKFRTVPNPRPSSNNNVSFIAPIPTLNNDASSATLFSTAEVMSPSISNVNNYFRTPTRTTTKTSNNFNSTNTRSNGNNFNSTNGNNSGFNTNSFSSSSLSNGVGSTGFNNNSSSSDRHNGTGLNGTNLNHSNNAGSTTSFNNNPTNSNYSNGTGSSARFNNTPTNSIHSNGIGSTSGFNSNSNYNIGAGSSRFNNTSTNPNYSNGTGSTSGFNSTSNHNNGTGSTAGVKRTVDYDSTDTIDLTDSQPKRSKIDERTQPSFDSNWSTFDQDVLSLANQNYDEDDDFAPSFGQDEFEDVIEEFDDDFGPDDGFGPDDDFGPFDDFGPGDDDWATPQTTISNEPMDIVDEQDDFFPPIDEDIITEISNQPLPPQQSKEELEMILSTLTNKQNQINNDIVEGFNNDMSAEVREKLIAERAEVVAEINDVKEKIKNHDSTVRNTSSTILEKPHEKSSVVILDDDEQVEVSPFFSRPSIPIPTTTAANINSTSISNAHTMSNTNNTVSSTHNATITTINSTLSSSSQPTYPWTRDVRKALIQTFKLSEFRPNQLEAINTTLNGEDVFVLMPTGGGKSLCYQLPAIIQRHKRQGVTFVVSPLLSLMQDQVEQLVTGKGIPAFMLNSKSSVEHKKKIFNDLYRPTPTMQLLYITPEMLNKSADLQNALGNLHRRNMLARFVIDEAHCVSQWGHDFRPDYKLLGSLKETYKDVPIMALTATANESVQKDVLFNLHIKDCKVLKQSFNRTNLEYQVVKKVGKTVLHDISKFIFKYRNQSGIIYCLSRKDCERVAEELRNNFGISIKHYHADVQTAEKSQVQREWQSGKIQVIAATIAFGMGIDKPDVRFVIHYSVPQSIEGYYQETGRAGRDGLPAMCRLYYSFADTKTINYMIEKNDKASYEQIRRQRENLNTMMKFCENDTDCRRKQILAYFGERFDPADCGKMCDNCVNNQHRQSVIMDKTKEAIVLINLIKQISPDTVTINQLRDIFRGAKNRRILEHGHDQLDGHGYGKIMSKFDVDRLLKFMVHEDTIREKSECNARGFPMSHVLLSSKANNVLNGSKKMLITYTTQSGPSYNQLNSYPRPTPRAPVQSSSTVSTSRSTTTTNNSSGFVPAGAMLNNDPNNGRRVLPNIPNHSRASTTTSRATTSTAAPAPARKKANVDPATLQCYEQLKKVRQSVMSQYNVKNPTSILSDTSLKHVAQKLPLNEREFLMVTNMKEDAFNRYGKQFLNISVKTYEKQK